MEAMKSSDYLIRRLSGMQEPEEQTEAERLKRVLLEFIDQEAGRFTDEEVLDASAPATQEGETQ